MYVCVCVATRQKHAEEKTGKLGECRVSPVVCGRVGVQVDRVFQAVDSMVQVVFLSLLVKR